MFKHLNFKHEGNLYDLASAKKLFFVEHQKADILCFDDFELQELKKKETIYDGDSTGSKLSMSSGSAAHDNGESLASLAASFGWQEALLKYYENNVDGLIRNFSSNRTNWLSCINAPSENRGYALEIGPGTGGVTRQLSEYYDVIAMDRSAANCSFLSHNALEANLSITPLLHGRCPLPFEDDQFDLVASVGSIEWLGYYATKKSAKEIVNEYLREIFRVLKPGGSLYVASENAKFIGYFFGIREAHTMLCNISMLKQEDANQVSENFTKSEFRNPTFSPADLSKVLCEIGFKNTESFWLRPDYSTPAYLVPLNAPNQILDYFIEQRLNPWDFHGERAFIYKFLSMLDKNLVHNFVEHYGVIASK